MTTTAVIGCGDVSSVHFQAIANLEGVDLVGVCDTDPDRLAEATRRHGVPGFADHRHLLETVRPEVVHICTPHHQHVPVAVDCLDAGVAVLVEKPVAHTLDDAGRLIAAARRHPTIKAGICLQNRYNETARAARALLSSGDLGDVLGGAATVMWHRTPEYYQARPWRGRMSQSGGGVLINQAIHTLDLMQWLLGDVVRVRGQLGRDAFEGVDIEDTAQLLLDHAGGARSVFFATNAYVVDAPVTIEIVTERAVLVIRDHLTVTYTDGRTETIAERRVSTDGRGYWGPSHGLLIADFYRSLHDSDPFWIGPEEGAKSLRLIDEVTRQNT
jgi:predicted dehydrogenase